MAVVIFVPAACAQMPPAHSFQSEPLREIDDPHTGDRWLLMRDETAPGGPGRFIRVTGHLNAPAGGLEPKTKQPMHADQNQDARQLPMIRAGDLLIVEEHSTTVDLVLQARALNSATQGSALKVRLAIGGKVVRAVALGPGRAALQPETGARP
jgi:hypothetical protein